MNISIKENHIEVSFYFNQTLVNLVRELPGAKWEKDYKVWIFPKSLQSYNSLKGELENKRIYHTSLIPTNDSVEQLSYEDYEFKTIPYAHQYSALDFALKNFNEAIKYHDLHTGIALFMEMGTGKSKVIVDIANIMYKEGHVKNVLVIVPLSIVNTWEEQIDTHAFENKNFTIQILGSAKKKLSSLKFFDGESNNIRWGLINPEAIDSIKNELCKINFDLIVIDESTMIKNHTAKRSKLIKKLQSKFKIIATGNPIPKCQSEVFSQYEFLEPGIFGTNFYKFRDKYFNLDYFNGIKEFKNKSIEADFTNKLYTIAFSCRKDDCLDLPPKIYEKRYAYMSDEQRKVYEEMNDDAMTSYNDIECSVSVVLSKFIRLSQIIGGALFSEDGKKHTLFPENCKLKLLQETLEEVFQQMPGQQVVIWARFNFEIEMIKSKLDSLGITNVTFYGKDSKDKRTESLKLFREKKVTCFIGSPATGSKGLNDLVGCNTVIYYSNSYSAEDREQSEARNHRQGVTGDHVLYIDLIAKDTIDELVMNVLKSNKSVSDAILSRKFIQL